MSIADERQLPPGYAEQLLEYDPSDNVLVWKVSCGTSCMKGSVAGRKTKEHGWCVWIDGNTYDGGRIADLISNR